MSRYDHGCDDDDEDLVNSAESSKKKKKKTVSVLYYMYTHNMSLSLVHIPSKIKIKQVCPMCYLIHI